MVAYGCYISLVNQTLFSSVILISVYQLRYGSKVQLFQVSKKLEEACNQNFLPLKKQQQQQKKQKTMEQQTGSKPGKEYFNVVYCHPAYLTYMQSTS